jgi:hypothetical protein
VKTRGARWAIRAFYAARVGRQAGQVGEPDNAAHVAGMPAMLSREAALARKQEIEESEEGFTSGGLTAVPQRQRVARLRPLRLRLGTVQ